METGEARGWSPLAFGKHLWQPPAQGQDSEWLSSAEKVCAVGYDRSLPIALLKHEVASLTRHKCSLVSLPWTS